MLRSRRSLARTSKRRERRTVSRSLGPSTRPPNGVLERHRPQVLTIAQKSRRVGPSVSEFVRIKPLGALGVLVLSDSIKVYVHDSADRLGRPSRCDSSVPNSND